MKGVFNLPQRLLWVSLTILSCVGLDQFTKSLVKAQLRLGDVHSLWGDTLRLQLAHNTGAFLGLGDSLPEAIRQPLFSLGVGALLCALLFYSLLSKSMDRLSLVALALVFAGGASNLGDRIVYGGYVVDFLYMSLGPLHTGIFNVADMAIMAGAFLLLLDAFRKDRANKST
jgi:signal peptidase II